jgi:hypothetical protein
LLYFRPAACCLNARFQIALFCVHPPTVQCTLAHSAATPQPSSSMQLLTNMLQSLLGSLKHLDRLHVFLDTTANPVKVPCSTLCMPPS